MAGLKYQTFFEYHLKLEPFIKYHGLKYKAVVIPLTQFRNANTEKSNIPFLDKAEVMWKIYSSY